jgi:LytS/YehU family sensor histidine kinase
MLWVNVPLVMFASVKFIYGYSNELAKKKRLEKLNLNAELSLLTMQLRPHFLFNTLNNLYSMAINRDRRTSDGISRVINLLKYILFVCNEEKVQLKKEIGLIYDYIELEKLRYDERLDFNFELDIYDKEAKIAPMILFTFVENSFKHGSSIEAGRSFIHLNLKSNKSRLFFHSINSYPKNKSNQDNSGLGLENVRKRLDLLYPENYELKIDKKDQVFEVSLDLSL